MRLMGRMCALALAFLPGARAQEDAPPPPPQYDYVLDETTELTLTEKVKDPAEPKPAKDVKPPKDSKEAKVFVAELRVFGEPAQGQIFVFSNEVRLLTKDVYMWKGPSAPNQQFVRVAGKPGEKTPLEVSTRYLVDDFAKPVRASGSFKPVDLTVRELRVKKRYEMAETALQAILTRTLAEVGKAGEAKLKEAHAERLKMREANAAAFVGPDAPKEGMAYWSSLWASTIETMNFLRSYTGRQTPKGLTGSYRAANGNQLELSVVPETAALTFTATVLRPTAEKTGVLTGTARLYGTRAVYKEPLAKKDAEGRQPAEVVLTQRGHVVKIEAKNTDEFGGPGVSFDGDYYKLAPRK